MKFAPICFASAALLVAASALAHPGHLADATAVPGLTAGLLHPLSGIDHWLAMLAVGAYAAPFARSLRAAHLALVAPLSFAAAFLIGASIGVFAGAAGVTLPAVEPMIAVSVLFFGLMLVAGERLPITTSSLLIGGFALFHGIAHGLEMPRSDGPTAAWPFLAGMLITASALQMLGFGAGWILRVRAKSLPRLAGGIVAFAGVALLSRMI